MALKPAGRRILKADRGELGVVASTAHCLDPAQPTPFADAALELRNHGLAPVPLGGDKGQATLIKWKTWKRPPHSRSLERLVVRFPTANVGVLTGLSGVTVVDVDDPEQVDAMLARFGDTTLGGRSPRRTLRRLFGSPIRRRY